MGIVDEVDSRIEMNQLACQLAATEQVARCAIRRAANGEKGLISRMATITLSMDLKKGESAAQKIATQVAAAKVAVEPYWHRLLCFGWTVGVVY